MSRKDYIRLAAALRGVVNDEAASVGESPGVRRTIIAIEDALAADNPRFDREKFLEAVYKVMK